MNPTISIAPRDTGILVAGTDLSKVTGVGIVVGVIGGYLIGGPKHRVIGTLLGLIGGFFGGRYADQRINADAIASVPIVTGTSNP